MKKQTSTADEIKRVQSEITALEAKVEKESAGVPDDDDRAQQRKLDQQLGSLQAQLKTETAAAEKAQKEHAEKVKVFTDKIDAHLAENKLTDEEDPNANARFMTKMREFLNARMGESGLLKIPNEKEAAKMLEQATAYAKAEPIGGKKGEEENALNKIISPNIKGGTPIKGDDNAGATDGNELLAKYRSALTDPNVIMDTELGDAVIERETGMTPMGHLIKEIDDFHEAKAA